MAKKSGKVLLPQYPPVQIFWSTARVPLSKKRMLSSGSEPEIGSPPSKTAQLAAARPPVQGGRGLRGAKPGSIYSWRPPGSRALQQVAQTSSLSGGTAVGLGEAALRGEESTDSSQTAGNWVKKLR